MELKIICESDKTRTSTQTIFLMLLLGIFKCSEHTDNILSRISLNFVFQIRKCVESGIFRNGRLH